MHSVMQLQQLVIRSESSVRKICQSVKWQTTQARRNKSVTIQSWHKRVYSVTISSNCVWRLQLKPCTFATLDFVTAANWNTGKDFGAIKCSGKAGFEESEHLCFRMPFSCCFLLMMSCLFSKYCLFLACKDDKRDLIVLWLIFQASKNSGIWAMKTSDSWS